ncbi:MAG: Fe-S cluster assembly protein SufD [Phenylobacterium sp.]
MTLSAAIRTGDTALLPSRRDEDWRWTDLRGLVRVLPPPSPAFEDEVGEGPFGAAELTVINGRLRGDPAVLIVPRGEQRTVRLRFVSASAATSHSVHLAVEVAAGAGLTLLESHEGGAADYVADAVLTIGLGDGARLERIVLSDEDAGAVAVTTAIATLAYGASYAQTVLIGGAKRNRIETRVAHPGHGAQVRLDGVYLLAGQRQADLTTVVTHAGVGGVTDQLTKGVVRDQARGVFQGRIVVTHGADKTDARMGHHALILSDRAEVDAKPELEIYAEDVACAHGNTVGALDEEALFYIRQRGIPEADARALLTEAFVGEVVDRIEHPEAREVAARWVARRLGG